MSGASLRLRLAATVVALVALALAALSLGLYSAVREAAWSQHDRGLVGRARSLAALVEHDEEDGYELELSPRELSSFAANAPPAYIEVWRPDGSVLARSAALGGDDLPVGAGSFRGPRFVDLVLPDGRAGRLVAVRFVPRGDDDGDSKAAAGEATLVLAEDIGDVRATLAAVRRWFWWLGALTLLGVAGATTWLVARGLAPLGRLAGEIATIDDRRLSARLDEDGQPAELAVPVRKLNELLARLDESFARERRFTADAGHELRTPLAGLRTLLEVTALKERSGDEYRAALADARTIVLQLATLVENLLTLARLDEGQVEVVDEDVALAALVEECWQAHGAQAARRRLTFRLRVATDAVVRTDGEKLRLVIANLLANAAEYTEEGGWIEASATDALLDVVDSGPPIAHLEKIFERFWRADPARSVTAHSGIGLSLVRSMCTCLALRVSASNLADGAVRFRIERSASADTPGR